MPTPMPLRRIALFALAVVAADAAPAGAAPPAKTKVFEALSPAAFDPARLLPAPPEDGSDRQKADLAEVERVYKSRTPARLATAEWDDKHETVELFFAVLGPKFDLKALPATARLIALAEHEQGIAANIAKRHFLRNRPWAIDTSLRACDYRPDAPPKTSYPSGHATLGHALGYLLADLMPEKAAAILARADDYAYSRVVCAAHYPSDLEASHVLGVEVATALLTSPSLKDMVAAARAELAAAGLAPPPSAP